MKIPVTILAILAVFYAFFWFTASPQKEEVTVARTDMPWQVKALPSGDSRVFDLTLGVDVLSNAVNKFGDFEKAAVFAPEKGEKTLEVYFGNVNFGPLKAKVVVSLQADTDELENFVRNSVKREGSATGDWKYTLSPEDTKTINNKLLTVISYVPATRALDAEFFKQRLGEPTAWLKESETAVSWFYPEIGLSLLIDDEYKEVLEYIAPKDFVMPAGVSVYGENPVDNN